MSHSFPPSDLHRLSSGVGQPASYRDASNNTQTSNGPWKAPKPTLIMTPTNTNSRPPPTSTRPKGANPFSDRMGTTLGSRGNTKYNHPANRVVLPRISPNFPGKRISETSASTADTIHIVDDSEDIGQPIVQRSSPPRSSLLSLSRVTRAESHDPLDLIQPSEKKRVTAKDGESTQRLAHRMQAQTVRKCSTSDVTPRNYISIPSDEDEDEIEDASDFDDAPLPPPPPRRTSRSSPHIPHGKVRHTVAKFEGINHNGVEEMQKDSPVVQTINFNTVGVKGKMKPKTRTKQLEFQPIDAQATVSAGYTTGPRPSSRPSSSTAASSSRGRFELPLEAHIYGRSSRPSRKDGLSGWLYLEGSHLSIHKSRGSPKAEFSADINNFFHNMEYTNSPYDESKPVILKLGTYKSTDKNTHVRLSGFVHGSGDHDGSMIFKFNTSHDEWDRKHYTGLIQALGRWVKERSSLNEHGSPRAWQMACSLAEEEVISDTDSSSAQRPKSDDQPSASTSSRLDRDLLSAMSKSAPVYSETSTRTRTQPRPIANTTNPYVRRSTRSTAVARISPQPDTDEIILVYPPNGTGAVNITNADLKRLAPGQYLNDTLIEFALKLWLNELREKDPKLAEQIHIFSSFFYKKIQVKNKEEGYSSVRKWTSKFDLFKKKYIVVPINENLHWYLAIICNPEFVLQPPPPSTTTVSSVQTRKRKRDSDALEQESSTTTLREPSERAHDSPTATADDENTVENILNDYNTTKPKANGSTDDLSMHFTEDGLFDDFGGELQYPDSDGVPGESSTDLAGPSRDRSEPIMIDDDAMDVDDPNGASTSAVPCTSFYASGSKNTKEPEDVSMSPEVPWTGLSTAPVNTDVPDLDLENDEPVVVETSDYRSDKTYIFTFDSLGGKHPGAIRNLGNYLQMEARDKKSLDNSQTTLPTGCNALVPAQPNYCDCGVYLIHFVRTFMSDPVKFSKKIVTKKPKDYDSKERELDWEADVVSSLRENLHGQALSLSEQWKIEKAVKEESKKQKEAAEAIRSSSKLGPEAEVIPDSDDEEIVVTGVRAATKRGGKGRQSRASHLR